MPPLRGHRMPGDRACVDQTVQHGNLIYNGRMDIWEGWRGYVQLVGRAEGKCPTQDQV